MKPLRILLGNNSLSYFAGSETWTLTLAFALKRAGHIVHVFTGELGVISTEIQKEGIPCFTRMRLPGAYYAFSPYFEEQLVHEYDCIIANHNHIVEHLRKYFPTTPIISTIHGIMHFTENERTKEKEKAPEHPSLVAGVNQFVAVSEEVQEKLLVDYHIESEIVRNFIDVKKFDAKRPITPGKPTQILFNTNYALREDKETKIIREVANHYGARMIAIGQNFNLTLDTMTAIEQSDIVVGMGRSVLEGICAGRLGIVHGRWGTGGVVHEGTINDIRPFNFSGRNSKGIFATSQELIAEIDKYYNQITIDAGRDYIRKEHNATFAAEEYVRFARVLLGQSEAKRENVIIKPYRRASDVKQLA